MHTRADIHTNTPGTLRTLLSCDPQGYRPAHQTFTPLGPARFSRPFPMPGSPAGSQSEDRTQRSLARGPKAAGPAALGLVVRPLFARELRAWRGPREAAARGSRVDPYDPRATSTRLRGWRAGLLARAPGAASLGSAVLGVRARARARIGGSKRRSEQPAGALAVQSCSGSGLRFPELSRGLAPPPPPTAPRLFVLKSHSAAWNGLALGPAVGNLGHEKGKWNLP